MSIRRLCVRISNCSRLSLCLWGERRIVTISFSVGSGIGPDTRALVRFAASTMRAADWSMRECSYALSLILIFWLAMGVPPFELMHTLPGVPFSFFYDGNMSSVARLSDWSPKVTGTFPQSSGSSLYRAPRTQDRAGKRAQYVCTHRLEYYSVRPLHKQAIFRYFCNFLIKSHPPPQVSRRFLRNAFQYK